MKKFFVLFLCLCAFAASLNAAENPMVLSSIAKLEEQLAPLPDDSLGNRHVLNSLQPFLILP